MAVGRGIGEGFLRYFPGVYYGVLLFQGVCALLGRNAKVQQCFSVLRRSNSCNVCVIFCFMKPLRRFCIFFVYTIYIQKR